MLRACLIFRLRHEDTVIDISIEHTQRHTDRCTVIIHLVFVSTNMRIVCSQFDRLILVEREVYAGIPLERTDHVLGLDIQLMTPETEFANVGLDVAETGRVGDFNLIQQSIGCLTVVIIDNEQTIIEQSQINSTIVGLSRFPGQIGVADSSLCTSRSDTSIEYIIRRTDGR